MSTNLADGEDWQRVAIQAARLGSHEALGRLFAHCRARLLRVANTELSPLLQAKGGASDIVQETFLKAQRGFDRFQGETEDELLAWLRTILRNYLANFARDYFRTAKRRVQRETSLDPRGVPDSAQDVQSPSRIVMAREQAAALIAALNRLPPLHRHVIELRLDQGMSFADIGADIRRSSDAARKLWSRALKQLESELKRG